MSLRDMLLIAAEAVTRGVQFWTKSPTYWWIEYVCVERVSLQREVYRSVNVRPSIESVDYTLIHLKVLNLFDMRWEPMTIYINQATHYIECDQGNAARLFARDNNNLGGEMLPILLCSAPAALVAMPAIVAARCYYAWREDFDGLSRHDWTLLDALEGKIDAETYAELAHALETSRPIWNGERYPPGYEPTASTPTL